MLIIMLQNGQPFNHPITLDNFKISFPDIDEHNLPTKFAYFERVDEPIPGVYEVVEHLGYVWEDNKVKDNWNTRPMNAQEVADKQNRIKDNWKKYGFTSWIFNESTCTFIPPISYPVDSNKYIWNEDIVNWQLANQE